MGGIGLNKKKLEMLKIVCVIFGSMFFRQFFKNIMFCH